MTEDDAYTENLRLRSELELREMRMRQMQHACLAEAIAILRKLLDRQDCDISGESWLMLAIGAMQSRQKQIAEQQFAALAGDPA